MTQGTTGKRRVLAVDDNDDTLELIALTLGPHYDVMTLSNPLDVYELIELFEPDLMISDVMMPKITGFQLLEILQKNPRTRSMPVIILSAKSAAGEIKHGYKLGATLYLTKPFEPERLLKNVKVQLEQAGSDQAKTLTIQKISQQMRFKNSFKSGTSRLVSADIKEEPSTANKAFLRAKINSER